MGLDMYLNGKKYVEDWAHNFKDNVIPEDTPTKQIQKLAGLGLPVTYVEVKVGYWRKANQIHKWFVDNVQNGEDTCNPYSVEREQLAELRQVCLDVLANHDKAEELLPTGSGFFFGDYDYDEWYFANLKDTVSIIDQCLHPSNADLYYKYQSSW